MKTKTLFLIGAIGLILGLTSLLDKKEAKKLASTDKYKVIRVDGRIIFQRTKTDMKQGDIFLSGTALNFTTPQARAAVISSLKGRFVLTSAEKGQTKILPAANNISSRSGALLNLIDLQNHFDGNYLVIDQVQLAISEQAFPLNEDNFFYLAYDFNGETIRKKLPNMAGNKFEIAKDEVFKVDGEAIEPMNTTMALYYMNDGNGSLINKFKPVFPNLDELKDEVEIILEEFSDKTDAIKIQEVTAYLHEFYGKPEKENLHAWLKAEFNLE